MNSSRTVWAKGILTTVIAACSALEGALAGAKSDWTWVQWTMAVVGVAGATLMAARNYLDQSISRMDPPQPPPVP